MHLNRNPYGQMQKLGLLFSLYRQEICYIACVPDILSTVFYLVNLFYLVFKFVADIHSTTNLSMLRSFWEKMTPFSSNIF